VARGDPTYRFRSGAVRLVIVLFGAAAIVWAASVLPELWRYPGLERIADHIIAGDLFKTKVLATLMPVVEAAERERVCDPAALRAAAILRLRLFEISLVGDEYDALDPQLQALQETTRRALYCLPSDSFLWVMLYWVDLNQNGYGPKDREYLRLSYSLGPNEGWIALKRNEMALATFDRLPLKMRDMVVAEFANLLNSGFENETQAILVGPGWKVRDRLLASLKDVKEIDRQDFAKALYHNGYDIAVPGVTLSDPRPWD